MDDPIADRYADVMGWVRQRSRAGSTIYPASSGTVLLAATGRFVTADGTTSWHDLAIHVISRHCSPGEALRIAKVYLLKWHGEGQRPYASLVRRQLHADSGVRAAEQSLHEHFREQHAVAGVVAASGIPGRSLKRGNEPP